MNTSKVTVFGEGTWGITLACLLQNSGHNVRVWEYDPNVVSELLKNRLSPRLPKLIIPPEMIITNDIDESLTDSKHWVIVTPSHGVRALVNQLAKREIDPETITVCAKGIEADSGMTMTQIIADELAGVKGKDGSPLSARIAVLSGPSHAEEVSRNIPTSVVTAADSEDISIKVQELFGSKYFRVYSSTDALGVELGGALKNIIAIATGVCDGMGFGDNTRAALITRGLAEMIRLGIKMGAHPETFSGMAGMGDLIVTAGSHHSRNRNFGALLGEGLTQEAARAKIGMEIEGIYAAKSAWQLADKHEVEMPIAQEVYQIIYEDKSPKDAVHDLLSREQKPEVY